MGKRWNRKRKQQERQEKAKKTAQRQGKRGVPWSSVVPGNAKFEAYYALLGLHNQYYDAQSATFVECTTDAQKEEERMKWLTSLRTMLPASFRIGESVDPKLRQRLELELDSHFCDETMEIQVDTSGNASSTTTQTIAPAKHIPFIPHAYQLSVDRRTIRRNPALQEFHTWLQTQTSCGNITRQETVSMIPPVVLSVEPHHYVLDMCAAPGSKTSQLLEIVSTFDSSSSTSKDGAILEPKGCVVANDSDAKRAYMLVHQLRRINSPAVLVTSCDAQFFPLLQGEGMFDRVLADVPCSGDGTARKNPGVWRNWSCTGSLSLHPLQLGIALNGARLTKVSGYLCYSTCAMSPIENEAVVAALLRMADGSLELVDKRQDMSGLVARPGWSAWRVFREDKTRKQIKDHRKKNNAKMQAKRKEWAKKNGGGGGDEENVRDEAKMEATTDDVKMEVATTNSADGDTANDETKAAAAAVDGAKQEAKEDDEFRSGGAPPSWDEESLLARVTAENLREYKSFDDVPNELKRSIRKTCFPPTPDEAETFGLEKCLRCLPQDMDTGGFFVALLKKVAPMSSKAKRQALELVKEFQPEAVCTDGNSSVPQPDAKRAKMDAEQSDTINGDAGTQDSESGDVNDSTMETDSQLGDTADTDNAKMNAESAESNDKKDVSDSTTDDNTRTGNKSSFRGRGKSRSENSEDKFVPINESTWASLEEFYGFADSFPRNQFMARASGEAKAVYFIGAPIKDMIDRGIQERIQVINSGLKAFAKNNKDCEVKYRVAQEGIQYLAPHMTKRKIVANVGDFTKCLETESIRMEVFSDEFAAAVRKLEPGAFVVALEGYENDAFKKLFLVMWRCRKDAVDSLVAKIEQDGIKSKLRSLPGYVETEKDATKAVTTSS